MRGFGVLGLVSHLGEPVAYSQLCAVPANLTSISAERQFLLGRFLIEGIFNILENEMLDFSMINLSVIIVKGSIQADNDRPAELGIALD